MSSRPSSTADPAGAETPGGQRLGANLTLFTVGTDWHTPRAVLDGLSFASAMKWSPNGEWLAFSATIDGVAGTWLLGNGDSIPVLAHSGETSGLAWSPDGNSVAITSLISQDVQSGVEIQGVDIVNVSKIVDGA